ncbi:MAG: hypothetical protein ACSLFA_25865 [Mycobacterium sp.]
MEALTSHQWRKQLEINVIGHLAVSGAVLPLLRPQAAGGVHLQCEWPAVHTVDPGRTRRRSSRWRQPRTPSEWN